MAAKLAVLLRETQSVKIRHCHEAIYFGARTDDEPNHARESVVLTYAEITHGIVYIRQFEARQF